MWPGSGPAPRLFPYSGTWSPCPVLSVMACKTADWRAVCDPAECTVSCAIGAPPVSSWPAPYELVRLAGDCEFPLEVSRSCTTAAPGICRSAPHRCSPSCIVTRVIVVTRARERHQNRIGRAALRGLCSYPSRDTAKHLRARSRPDSRLMPLTPLPLIAHSENDPS